MRESARKGFVTIATGNSMYYIMARNLLLSYRHFAKDPLPFAIICDRTNRYTDCFDDVILLRNPSRSYNDKLCLPSLVPYDQTIFIDADCLAYSDLNDMWKMFEGAPAFGVLGRQLPLDSEKVGSKKAISASFRTRSSSASLSTEALIILTGMEQAYPTLSALSNMSMNTFLTINSGYLKNPATNQFSLWRVLSSDMLLLTIISHGSAICLWSSLKNST